MFAGSNKSACVWLGVEARRHVPHLMSSRFVVTLSSVSFLFHHTRSSFATFHVQLYSLKVGHPLDFGVEG